MTTETKKTKAQVWVDAYCRVLDAYALEDILSFREFEEADAYVQNALEKIAVYGIKRFGLCYDAKKDYPKELLEVDRRIMRGIIETLSFITPRQFIGWFPIVKDYNGAKNDRVDYYSTMRYIEKIGLDNPIKDGFLFLFGYWNEDVMKFMTNYIMTMGNIRREETGEYLEK